MRATNRMIDPNNMRWVRPALIAGAVAGLMALSALAGIMALAGPPEVAATAAVVKPAMDPQADQQLRRMGDYLAQAPFFSVSAEVWQDIRLGSGQQIQAGRTIELQVRRPNRFHAEVRSPRRDRGLYYDGASITLLDRVHNFYGSFPAPATLDEALDAASDRFGIALPLEDLIVSDPYQNLMDRIVSGIRLETETVLGVPCQHLAFSLAAVDWQVWIEEGARPVPRKIVITYKDEEGSPEYTAIFTNWDFQTRLPDFLFNFEPPPGAAEIGVAEIKSKNQAHENEVNNP
jgi:hypothetical protein